VLAREIGWQRRAADAEEARQAAMDTRRQRASTQLDRERARVDDQRVDAERRLEAKRQVHDQLWQRFRDNADELGEKQARHIAALTEQRINRNIEANDRAADVAETHARRQVYTLHISIVTFCDSTLNTANLCPAISVVGLFYLLTVIMNFVCWFILGVDFTRRFRFCMCA